jgi:hypothetical protein
MRAKRKPARNRRILPSRQRTYIHLRTRVDRLEDAIGHFYDVINDLRGRVSTLETQGTLRNDEEIGTALAPDSTPHALGPLTPG